MIFRSSRPARAIARRLFSIGLTIAVAIDAPARADDSEGVALDLDEAASLAVTAQPVLLALEAQARAARQSAAAARQLPDPQLTLGFTDLPVNGSDAGSFTRDSDTQLQLGLAQEFPRAAKRRLRGEAGEGEALRLDAEQGLALRAIRRDAALDWLELWRYDQALQLTKRSLREAQAQAQAVEIALRTGSATQAEFLAARQDAGRLEDAVRGAEQSVEHARSTLYRWIGEAALRPVCPELPLIPTLPALEVALERLRTHPQLAGAAAQLRTAQTGAELARAAYRPDWRIELGYGERPAYSDMVSLQVGIDLPLFPANRQDRSMAAALAQQDAAALQAEDARRRLVSETRLNHHDFESLQRRLTEYERSWLPQGETRIQAALAGWRSGRNSLREVLEARRANLELQMARLDLQLDLAKHFVQLTYLGAFDGAPVTGSTSHE